MSSLNTRIYEFLSTSNSKFTIEGIADALKVPPNQLQHIVKACWALQKLGVVKFRESHVKGNSYIYDIQSRSQPKKLAREEILFEMAIATAEREPVDTRKESLRIAAKLLEDAGEITLAILVLDALEDKPRDLALYAPINARRPMVYMPGSGRQIRQLTPEEAEHIDW